MTRKKEQHSEYMELADQLPPHDLEIERAVLGALLISDKAVEHVISTLKAEDFYSENHRVIYRAIQSLAQRDKPVDHLTVAAALEEVGEYEKIGGRRYVFQIVESIPVASNTKQHTEIVKWMSIAREAIDAASGLTWRMSDHVWVDSPEEKIVKARDRLDDLLKGDSADRVHTFAEDVDELMQRLKDKVANKGIVGYRSGLGTLDFMLGGFVKGRFYLFAARPAMGKSMTLAQMAVGFAQRGISVLLQSPEMHRQDYLERLSCAMVGVTSRQLERGDLTTEELQKVRKQADTLGELPLVIDDAGMQTVSRIRRNCIRYRPQVVMVDYVQKLAPENPRMGRVDQVTQLSNGLDAVKKDFEVVVISAAQLSRGVEQRDNKRPNLSDLRDSGALEQDADVIIFPFREHYYDPSAEEGVVEFNCGKNRHGRTFHTTLYQQGDVLWLSETPRRLARDVF